MKTPRTLVVLTVMNVAIAIVTMAHHLHPALADDPAPVLRGRGLQIVDGQGRIRASISVLPATGRSSDGGEQAETVLLKLITERGRPTIKIGASEPASGLSVVGPTGTKETYVILQAKGAASALKLRSEDGRERVVAP